MCHHEEMYTKESSNLCRSSALNQPNFKYQKQKETPAWIIYGSCFMWWRNYFFCWYVLCNEHVIIKTLVLGCDELSCLNIGMNLCDEFNGQNDNVNFLMAMPNFLRIFLYLNNIFTLFIIYLSFSYFIFDFSLFF